MARPLRVQYPGAFYHVTSRGNERKPIFKSARDREKFLSYLQSAHERYGAIIHVYCLMENHYHLLLETPHGNLSQILHHINGAYTTHFNIKMQRSGHLFQGRYKAVLVQKDAYSRELSRYIHLNPVRAGVAETPLQCRWSSYPYYIGIEKRPPWLTTRFILGYFGQDETSTQKNYQTFVEDALAGKTKNPLTEVFASTFLGSPDFIGWVKEEIGDLEASNKRNVPALRKLVEKRSLERIERTIEDLLGRDHPLFKKFCMYVSQQHGGFSLKEIGAHYSVKGPAVSQSNRRLRQKILEDRDFKQLLDRIVRRINSVEC